jgi:hypothetical protein
MNTATYSIVKRDTNQFVTDIWNGAAQITSIVTTTDNADDALLMCKICVERAMQMIGDNASKDYKPVVNIEQVMFTPDDCECQVCEKFVPVDERMN